MVDSKPVEFRGNALDELRAFPQAARREAEYQLDRVQHGRKPDDWKPMNTVGREGSGKFGFALPWEHSECCMWRSSTTPSMCCTASRKRRRKRAKRI
jgi:hypothetical protein